MNVEDDLVSDERGLSFHELLVFDQEGDLLLVSNTPSGKCVFGIRCGK